MFSVAVPARVIVPEPKKAIGEPLVVTDPAREKPPALKALSVKPPEALIFAFIV